MTVEEKALIWARRQKGNVLNNKNVDCFIAGYNTADKEYKEIINKEHKEILKEILTELPDKLEKQIENEKQDLDHSGYMYCYPDSFIKRKSAYIALRDALRQCEEFMDDIKLLV